MACVVAHSPVVNSPQLCLDCTKPGWLTAFSLKNGVSDLSTAFLRVNAVLDLSTTFSY